jgi:hypothetical protein
MRLNRPKIKLIDLAFLLTIIFILILISYYYVSQELSFYSGDFATARFHAITTKMALELRASPLDGIKQIQTYMAYDYNAMFTIPILPFVLIFGNTRFVYTTTVILVYLLPFALVLGAISLHLIKIPLTEYNLKWRNFAVNLSPHRALFWLTVIITLITPTTWVPTLRGYPDIGGCLFISLALLIYLQNIKLKHWQQIGLIGIFVALAILFRRHFAYSSIALIIACFLGGLIHFIREKANLRLAVINLINYNLRLSLILVSSFVTLIILAWQLFTRIATNNYTDAYASYTLAFPDLIQLYNNYYGTLFWVMIILGLIRGFTNHLFVSPKIYIFFAYSLICLMQWLLILRYDSLQYTLHITPFMVLCLTSFIVSIPAKNYPQKRKYVLIITSIYLIINLIFSLTPLGKFTSFYRPIFATSYPPPYSQDYHQAIKMVNYLRELANHQEPIFVMASSDYLSHRLVFNVERELYGNQGQILNLLPVPHIDSRDNYPLETLLQAKYLVYGTPLRYRLEPKEHDVSQVIYDAFTEKWEITQDFQALPIHFNLDGDIAVTIYQRIKPTSLETAIKTFAIMQERVGVKPSNQLDWIPLDFTHPYQIQKNPDNTYNIVTKPTDPQQQNHASFLYIDKLTKTVTITGYINFVNKSCLGTSLLLTLVDKQGKMINNTKIDYLSSQTAPFTLTLPLIDATYAILQVIGLPHPTSSNYCDLTMAGLRVK